MDFRGRQSQSSNRQPSISADDSNDSFATSPVATSKQKSGKGGIFKVGSILLLFAAAALIVATIFLMAFNGGRQMAAVDNDTYQAVFMGNGQVYFGKIKSFRGKTLDLRGIYYLQTNETDKDSESSATSTPAISLVKLGCELHAPADQMLINLDQVLFWENITSESKVADAIKQYREKNGSKITCDTASSNSTDQAPSSSSTGTGTSTQNTTTPSTSTGTNSTTKKP